MNRHLLDRGPYDPINEVNKDGFFMSIFVKKDGAWHWMGVRPLADEYWLERNSDKLFPYPQYTGRRYFLISTANPSARVVARQMTHLMYKDAQLEAKLAAHAAAAEGEEG